MISLPPHMLIIFGPTGVGKSDLAEEIAQSIPAEIVNMDVGQLYTPLTIGTAKPDWRNSSIPHHLFDVVHEPIDYSVALYRTQILELIKSIWNKGKMPILVGGSGFYLKSLLFPPTVPIIAANNTVVTAENVLTCWDELRRIDPVRAGAIDKYDVYRVGRALAIWYSTGVKPSEYKVVYEPPASYTLLFLTRSRQELYERINFRVDLMMNQGWLKEAESLCQTAWEPFLLKKKLIGYNELLQYVHGARTESEWNTAVSLIKQRTRHYAKRQHTFWRMLKEKLEAEGVEGENNRRSSSQEINLTLLNRDLYIKLLVQRLNTLMHEQ